MARNSGYKFSEKKHNQGNKLKTKIYGIALLVLLALAWLSIFNLANGEPVASKQTTNKNFQKELDTSFLKLLGLYSGATIINTSVNIYGNALTTDSAGYSYSGKFISGNRTYVVQSDLQESHSQKAITRTENCIIGGSMNTRYTTQEVNKTSGTDIICYRTLKLQTTNSSGEYHLKVNSTTLISKTTSGIISSDVQLEQDLFAPIGKTSINITPQKDSDTPKVVFRLPDGNQLTTYADQLLPKATKSAAIQPQNKLGTQYSMLDDYGVPIDDYGWSISSIDPFDPYATDHGVNTVHGTNSIRGLELTNYRIWWLPSWAVASYVYWLIADTITGAITGGIPFGAAAGFIVGVATDLVGIFSPYFQATVDPYDNLTIEYVIFETKATNVAGLTIKLPYCFEIGFYTNYVLNPLTNLEEWYDWHYFPAYMLCIGHQSGLLSMIDWKHESHWSRDLPEMYTATVNCYDESISSYISNAAIKIDNQWIPAGNTFAITGEDHIFQAADSGGAFDCFFNGTNYFGNSAVITVSADTTITLYYHYIPTYNVDFRAYNMYCEDICVPVYLYGNCVGYTPCSLQIPIGYHSDFFPEYTYDEWANVIINHGGYYPYPVVSNTYAEAYYY